MEQIEAILSKLPEPHRGALQWFLRYAGKVLSWPQPIYISGKKTELVCKPKGIYKPRWMKYALSVRQGLAGKYNDREPVKRPDGTWIYPYYQEGKDPSKRDEKFTNRALMNCMADGVPVGVLRQLKGSPASSYHVLGLALVSHWDDGHFFLEGFSSSGLAASPHNHTEADFLSLKQEQIDREKDYFNFDDTYDAREKIMSQIVRRRGQPEFRRTLLKIYSDCCAISGCDVADALEAAHILPYNGPNTNKSANGLLLRADLHVLFDLHLISVDSETMTTLVCQALLATKYAYLQGKELRLPKNPADRPSLEALDLHRKKAGL